MPPERVEDGGSLPQVVCGFPIAAEFVGAEGFMVLPRFELFAAPGLRVRLTNTDTDTSVQYTISGTFRDVFNDDGSVTAQAAGTNLSFGVDPLDGEFLLVVTRGSATLHFPDAGGFSTFTVDARRVTDVCDELDPGA